VDIGAFEVQGTATTVSAAPSPSAFGRPVTLTATVTSGTSPVTGGAVTFSEGSSVLAGAVPLDASGRASFSIATLPVGSHTITAAYSGTGFFASSDSTAINVNPATPTVTWPTPAAIVYGTPLGGTQLDATADVPGTFSYSVAPGAILGVGSHTLLVTFTPADTADYRGVSTSVQLDVLLPVPALRVAFVGDPPAPGGLALGPAVVFNGPVFFGRQAFRLRDRHGHAGCDCRCSPCRPARRWWSWAAARVRSPGPTWRQAGMS
jgi:hypothetical protein